MTRLLAGSRLIGKQHSRSCRSHGRPASLPAVHGWSYGKSVSSRISFPAAHHRHRQSLRELTTPVLPVGARRTERYAGLYAKAVWDYRNAHVWERCGTVQWAGNARLMIVASMP